MLEEKIETSPELAYWIGVAQSDGCLTKYRLNDNRYSNGKEERIELSLGVSSKSFLMMRKFRNISKTIFERNNRICKSTKRDEWKFKMGVKSLLQTFKSLDINLSSNFFIPPKWTLREPEFFGSYLAGLIDGDGNVVVKRPQYPQCAVTISSGSWQNFLVEAIKKIVGCSVNQSRSYRICFSKTLGRSIAGTSYRLQFLVSFKNAKFLSDFVVPYLQLIYKRDVLQDFINERCTLIPNQ